MKKVFTALALVAMLNMAALAGLGAYAKMRNWLTKDRVRRAVAVLKGEEKEPGPTTMPASEKPPAPQTPGGALQQEMVVRTEFDRRIREIQDGWKLLETQQLSLVRDRESLEQDKARIAEQQRQKAISVGDNGLQKELEVLGGIKAKQAKDLLRQKQDADVAAILKSMDDRKVRKIVGECKTAEERQWIGRILEQLRDGRATQAEVLDAGA